MRKPLVLCALLLISSLAPAAASPQTYTGSWFARPDGSQVELQIRYSYRDGDDSENWSESRDYNYSDLRGISSSDFNSGGEHKTFSLVTDPGEFRADGWFAGGHGSGGWTFVPSSSFRSEMQRRGVGGIGDADLFHLAMSDFKLATIDQLRSAGFTNINASDLVRMGEHGVSADYIAGMRNVSFNPKTIDGLIRMRDHGVTVRFVQDLSRSGFHPDMDEVARLRDHGVSSDYVQDLDRLGYHPSIDDLVRLRDHGVTAAFIERMRAHGYTHLSADDLIRLRDHGF